MKKLLTVIIMLFSLTAFADTSEVPAYLKDAVITVKLKNGKEYTYSANEYAVVKRSADKAEPVVAQEKLTIEQWREKEPLKKNRVRAAVGFGPTGLQSKTNGNTVKVTPKLGPVVGVGYDRLINESTSVNGQIFTNGTTALGLGLDF